MKLTVLGKYGPYPKAGGATTGYILREDDYTIMIDCGSGVFSKYREITDGFPDVILASHLHSDHVNDLFIMRYALATEAAKGFREAKQIPLYMPATPCDIAAMINFNDVYDITTIKDGDIIKQGPFTITFPRVKHPLECYGMRIECKGKVLFYTGDTRWFDGLIDLAVGVDMLVADCGLQECDKGSNPFHMSALEVGILANKAGVKNLTASHIWPGYDENEVIAEIRQNYSEAIIAEEMKTYEI